MARAPRVFTHSRVSSGIRCRTSIPAGSPMKKLCKWPHSSTQNRDLHTLLNSRTIGPRSFRWIACITRRYIRTKGSTPPSPQPLLRRVSHDSRNLHALPPQVLAIQGALRLFDLSGIHELHVGKARRRAGNLIANQPQTRDAIASSLDPGPKIIVVTIGRNIREQQFRRGFSQIHSYLTSSRRNSWHVAFLCAQSFISRFF